ncbi:MAG TPA: tetratricopeptide repeat protein [Kiritimatiellia bacterium]|nr:tetratricopeptide repeat protein [Kiritimatiellia bacterium]HRZ12498.1 tetratricopeptide repeat protein [Kiritimatiellia bacterium]HSA17744.1 tetratricopeptide repeat protein [Kiritimatiellia bacterium]
MRFPGNQILAVWLAVWAGLSAAAEPGRPPDFPTDWTNLNELAQFHAEETQYLLEHKDLDAASLEVQQALSLAPDHPTLLWWAADLYTKRGQYAMSESYWARLSELYPSNAWVFARWGNVFFELDRFDRAQVALARAIELDPAQLSSRYLLASIHLMNGRRDLAEPLLEGLPLDEVRQMATWIQTDADLLAGKFGYRPLEALCQLALGRRSAGPAESGSEPTVEEWKARMGSVAVALAGAMEALTNRQWAAVRDGLEAAREAGLESPDATRDHALALYRLGEKTRAIEELEQLIAQRPEWPGAQRIYGLVLLEEREYDKAVEALVEARKMADSDAETAFALICAYSAARRFTDARDTARALPPEQARQVAAWAAGGHPYDSLLETNRDLRTWLRNLGAEPPPATPD